LPCAGKASDCDPITWWGEIGGSTATGLEKLFRSKERHSDHSNVYQYDLGANLNNRAIFSKLNFRDLPTNQVKYYKFYK
jgi:hypothetical protein